MIPFTFRLGLDLAEVDRIARAIDRWGETFLERLFNAGEVDRRRRHPAAFSQHVAGRFAAKEAAMKALGTGFRGLSFREIVVGRETSGKPNLRFQGRASRLAERLSVASVELTITHTERTAAAVVLLVCAPPIS
ncbi:MAG TPA: holo-ACP synthase [Thermoanaerobaculia bacterium]|nr:holo-ACP synthase [Thermoanaerobaculia bacterium]